MFFLFFFQPAVLYNIIVKKLSLSQHGTARSSGHPQLPSLALLKLGGGFYFEEERGEGVETVMFFGFVSWGMISYSEKAEGFLTADHVANTCNLFLYYISGVGSACLKVTCSLVLCP